MVSIREYKKQFIKAINDETQIELWYLSEEGNTYRKVDPWYLLRKFDRYYYLIGYCHLRKEIRTFHLGRIESFTLLNKTIVEKPISLSKFFELKRKQSSSDFFELPGKFTAYGYPHQFEENIKGLGVKIINEKIEEYIENINKFPVKKTTTGYPLTIQLNKMKGSAKCRSPLEHKVLLELENDKRIREIEVEPIKIQYFYKRVSHLYKPDLLVHYVNGKKDLIEVKLSGDIGMPKNQAKFAAAIKYAEENGLRFFIIGTPGNSRPHSDRSDWTDIKSIEIDIYDSKDITDYDPHSYTYHYRRMKRKSTIKDYPILTKKENRKESKKLIKRKLLRYRKSIYKLTRIKRRCRYWRNKGLEIKNRNKRFFKSSYSPSNNELGYFRFITR
jgi:hypothetical protein